MSAPSRSDEIRELAAGTGEDRRAEAEDGDAHRREPELACAERYERLYDNLMKGRIESYPTEWGGVYCIKPGAPEPSRPMVIGV